MAAALQSGDGHTPQQNYASVKFQVPDTKEEEIVLKITSNEPNIEYISTPDADYPNHMKVEFDCTFPSEYYRCIKVGKLLGKRVRAKFEGGMWFYCSSAFIAKDMRRMQEMQDYVELHNLASVKYRQGKDFHFSFRDQDLYMMLRYFAKHTVYGKFYSCQDGVKGWKGRRFMSINILPSILS